MRIQVKLVVIVVFVACVPLVISALTALTLHRRAFDDKVRELHAVLTDEVGARGQSFFDQTSRNVTLAARAIPWASLKPGERDGAVWLVYRQADEMAVASLLDERGEGVGPAAYVDASTSLSDMPARIRLDLAALRAFAQHIPFAQAQEHGTAWGDVFTAPGVKKPLVVFALRLQDAKLVFAAAVSLDALCNAVLSLALPQMSLSLIDGDGRIVCHRDASALLLPVDRALEAHLRDAAPFQFVNAAGEQTLGAAMRTANGWTAIAEIPVAAAFAASRRMLWQTVLWILVSLIAAILAGLLLGRGITQPVQRLVTGARALSGGDFSHRLPEHGRDELAKLSSAFNQMAEGIAQRDNEIRAWNEQLQRRVEERTRDLRETRDQLLQSQKLAAVASLAAGVAHEINNPLTGVIGLAQFLETRLRGYSGHEEDVSMLKRLEAEGVRIKDIVKTLMTFSQDHGGESFTPLDVERLLDESLTLIKEQAAQQGLVIERDYAGHLPQTLGDRSQLLQAFLHLFRNACIAMKAGGHLKISTALVDGSVIKITVADTGKGIKPEHLPHIFEPFFTTKENWRRGWVSAYRLCTESWKSIVAKSRSRARWARVRRRP